MLSSPTILCYAVGLSLLLKSLLVLASPLEEITRVQLKSKNWRRQDDSSTDENDEPDDDIAATDPLRDAVAYRALYRSQASATWYQIDVASVDDAASFTSFTVTPSPTSGSGYDPKQTQGSYPFNVDHIFEIQVIVQMCLSGQPDSSIPADAWSMVTNAVLNSGPACTDIAKNISSLPNLMGIPSAVNGFKGKVFRQVLNGTGGPGSGYYNFFGPAVKQNLLDKQQNLYDGLINDLGDGLASIGGNNDAVKTYFTNYARDHYQSAITFISNWTGKTYDRSAAMTTAPTPAAASTTPTPSLTQTCSETDIPNSQGKGVAQWDHVCLCNIGPTPSPTFSKGAYLCPTSSP